MANFAPQQEVSKVLYIGDVVVENKDMIFPADNIIRLLQHAGFALEALMSDDPASRFLAAASLHRVTKYSGILKLYPVVEHLSVLDWTVQSSAVNSNFRRACASLADWVRSKHWSYAADPYAWSSLRGLLVQRQNDIHVDDEDILVGLATLGVAVDFNTFDYDFSKLYDFVNKVLTDYTRYCGK